MFKNIIQLLLKTWGDQDTRHIYSNAKMKEAFCKVPYFA